MPWKDPEERRAYFRMKYATDPEYRERKRREANRYKDRANARRREKYAADPEYREKYKNPEKYAKSRVYKKLKAETDPKYKEQENLRKAQWIKNNVERHRELCREWAKRNSDYRKHWLAKQEMEMAQWLTISQDIQQTSFGEKDLPTLETALPSSSKSMAD